MAVRVFILFVVLTTFISPGRSQPAPPLAGVWEMVSQSCNGELRSFEGRKLKLLTTRCFVWVARDKEYANALLERKTERDSLEAFCRVFGAGTYEISDSTCTERLELFYDPGYIGRVGIFAFHCDGGMWYMRGEFPLNCTIAVWAYDTHWLP